jgi:hypothetical protein
LLPLPFVVLQDSWPTSGGTLPKQHHRKTGFHALKICGYGNWKLLTKPFTVDMLFKTFAHIVGPLRLAVEVPFAKFVQIDRILSASKIVSRNKIFDHRGSKWNSSFAA